MTDKKKREEDEKKQDNVGDIVITNDGVGIGIGGGLTIDPFDGSVGVKIGPGTGIDFG